MLVSVKGRKQECPEKNQIIILVLVPSLQVVDDDKIAVYPSIKVRTNVRGVMFWFTCVVPWRLRIASSAANTVRVYDSAPACSRSKRTAVVMFP